MTWSGACRPTDCGLHGCFDLANPGGAEYLLVEAAGERLQPRLGWVVDNQALPF